jgi:hypothetical protein
LKTRREIDELGLDEALDAGVVIVEWPERAEAALPTRALRICLNEEGQGRIAVLSSHEPAWHERVARMTAVDRFLDRAGWAHAARRRIPGDASSRRYERLSAGPGGATALLMDMPARPDGPPVRDGKPYSRIANLAEDIRAVDAVNTQLIAQGYSAPAIIAIDHAARDWRWSRTSATPRSTA